jgi:hypothetical protein
MAERAAAWSQLEGAVAALPPVTAPTRTVSIVLVADGGARITTPVDGPAVDFPDFDVVVARRGRGETAATSAARAASTVGGDLVCFVLATSTTLETGWLARLAAVVDGRTVVAATPVVVHPVRAGLHATPHDGRVRARGVTLTVVDDAPALRANDAGSLAPFGAGSAAVMGTTGACILVDRRAYEAAGAMPESEDIDVAMFELGRRLRARGGQVVSVSDSVVVDRRDVSARRTLEEPVSTGSPAWRVYVEARGPELMREVERLPAGILRIALTVAAPSAKVGPRWGDWHLAQAFARALRRRGHVVRVQTLDHSDDLAGRACDLHVVVRGLRAVRRTPGQAHVLWVISHPEQVTDEECDDADLVLVASVRFAEELRTRTRTPVEVMLQATDILRFRRVPADPIHMHDVAVVAKSRDVFRASVADALAAGLRPSIYGSGWETFVDPALVVSDYVPNEELARVYSSVGVLLNDHWRTMHEWGFVSNRLFDALACETPVISDDLIEIADLFDGAVLTYRDTAELRDLVDSVLADRPAARERAARGRTLIIEQHTFDHRAAQLLDALRRFGLDRSAG